MYRDLEAENRRHHIETLCLYVVSAVLLGLLLYVGSGLFSVYYGTQLRHMQLRHQTEELAALASGAAEQSQTHPFPSGASGRLADQLPYPPALNLRQVDYDQVYYTPEPPSTSPASHEFTDSRQRFLLLSPLWGRALYSDLSAQKLEIYDPTNGLYSQGDLMCRANLHTE